MEKLKWPLGLVSGYLLLYLIAPYAGVIDDVIILMSIFSPVALIWMVVKILKQGKPSSRSFDEYFYEDLDYKRNVADEDDPGDL